MSDRNPPSTVVLSGRPGGTTHRAVEVLAELPAEFRLIGGLAVMCRVGLPHRATVDLDAITRGLASHHELLAHLAVISMGGGQYRMRNDLDLDVIDIAPESAHELAGIVEAAATDDTGISTIRDRLHRWFVDGSGRDRTYRELRRFDDPSVDFDDVADAVALLG